MRAPLRSPSPRQQDLHELPRTRPPPYPHPHSGGQRHALNTSNVQVVDRRTTALVSRSRFSRPRNATVAGSKSHGRYRTTMFCITPPQMACRTQALHHLIIVCLLYYICTAETSNQPVSECAHVCALAKRTLKAFIMGNWSGMLWKKGIYCIHPKHFLVFKAPHRRRSKLRLPWAVQDPGHN